jgi:hypothetical protein
VSARYYKLACLVACALLSCTALASPLGVTVYSATTPQSPVKQGAKSVTFDLKGFSGTIGNATFSSETIVLKISADQDGDRLNDIPYTVTGGTMIIVDVR